MNSGFPAIATSQAFPAEIGSFSELCRKNPRSCNPLAEHRCNALLFKQSVINNMEKDYYKSNDRRSSAANAQGNLGNGALALMWITCVV